MSDEKFEIQSEVRKPWRRFIDEIAPLRPELFRFCCGLTGNVWDGEDLLQDTLLRVFGRLGKMDADLRHPRAYIVRAATHLWIDRLRHAGLERTHAQAKADLPAADDDPTLSLAVRQAANRLFLHLAPQERAALLLKDVLDISLEETASLLRTSPGAVKSALHRGRLRLAAAAAEAPPTAHRTPRALVERFVTALSAGDVDAVRALCLADVEIDMVGGAVMDSFDDGKMVFQHAHFVKPEWGFGENPHWRVAIYEGEPVVLGFRTLGGVEGLNEIWRFEAGEAGVTRVRLYCFSPDVLAQVARDLGLPPALRRPYRSPP